jgi:hypothetical protein
LAGAGGCRDVGEVRRGCRVAEAVREEAVQLSPSVVLWMLAELAGGGPYIAHSAAHASLG